MGLPDFGEDLLHSPLLGGGLPQEAERLLERAGANYHLTDVAETALAQAEAIAPGHVAVLIAQYRFYFYKNRLFEALDIACQCVAKAMRENVLGDDWRKVQPEDAPFGEWGAIDARFFMFSLKGYAYLSLRLGRMEEGRRAIDKLLDLDPKDRINVRLLRDVIDRMDAEDEDD